MSSPPALPDPQQLELDLLAGCVANPAYAPVALSILGELWAEAFTTPTHRLLAEALALCAARQEGADLRALQRWLDVHHPELVPYLLDTVATAAIAGIAVEPAAQRLRDVTGIRLARRAAATLLENDYESLGEMQAELQQLFGHVNTGSVTVHGARTLVEAEQQRYTQRRTAAAELTGIPTGIHPLDAVTRGLQAGSVNLIGGRPSHGKSALASQIGLYAASRRHPVYIFTHEMSASQYLRRMVCNLSRLDYGSVDAGRLNFATEQRMREAHQTLAAFPLHIIDEVGVAPAHYRAALCYLVNRHGPGLVIIDYIQLEYERDSRETRAAELGRICVDWRAAMKRTRCACLMVAQLNRGAAGKPPELHEFRDSGTIEQEAATALLLYRPGKDNPELGGNYVELNLAKNRDGALAKVALHYAGYCMRFDLWREGEHHRLTDDEWRRQERAYVATQRDTPSVGGAVPAATESPDLPTPEEEI